MFYFCWETGCQERVAFPRNHAENKAMLNEVGARNKQWGRGGLAYYLYRRCWSEARGGFSGGWLDPFLLSLLSSSQLKPGKQKPVSGAGTQGRGGGGSEKGQQKKSDKGRQEEAGILLPGQPPSPQGR